MVCYWKWCQAGRIYKSSDLQDLNSPAILLKPPLITSYANLHYWKSNMGKRQRPSILELEFDLGFNFPKGVSVDARAGQEQATCALRDNFKKLNEEYHHHRTKAGLSHSDLKQRVRQLLDEWGARLWPDHSSPAWLGPFGEIDLPGRPRRRRRLFFSKCSDYSM